MPTTNPTFRSRPHWVYLTRHGVPEFIVARRPLLVNNVSLPIGSPLPAELVVGQRAKLQRLYEVALIEPVQLPQAAEPRKVTVKPVLRSIPVAVPVAVPVPALAFDLPDIETPVAVMDEPEIEASPTTAPDLSRFFASAKKPNKKRKA